MESLRQVESGLVERQMMHRRPQIQHVPLSAAVSVETLEDVLAQVGREGWLCVAGLAMDRAGTAQTIEQSQVAQDLLHADLLAEEREVDLGPSGAVRRLDRGRRRHYGGSGRGDHFFRGHVPFVAHGCCVVGGGQRAAGRVGFRRVVAAGRVAGIAAAALGVVLAGANRIRRGCGVGGLAGRLPSKVLFVKRPIGFPDGIDEMEQFPHAVAQRDIAAFALGTEATIEGPDGRIMDDGRACGVP
jgi:hypothetical protein